MGKRNHHMKATPGSGAADRCLAGAVSASTVLLAFLSLFACGCSVSQWANNGFKIGPEHCRPQSPVSNDWMDADDKRLVARVPGDPNWWSTLNDPLLDGLIESAYQQNLSLREAGWRVMQARAMRSIAAGSVLPQNQGAFGHHARIMQSETVALPAPLRTFDQLSTGLSLAWEIDVWGRYRRSIAAADANVQVAQGDYDAILLSLIAEVATAYTDYRTSQLQLHYAKRNLEIQESSLQLTREKANQGATGFTGVYLAQSSLESTRAGIPLIEKDLRQTSNRLCTLLGLPAQDISEMLGHGPIPQAPVEVAVGIPANLVRRRPDIRSAERAVAAQSERIGIAMADWYPAFTITGEFAIESEKFSDLFRSASTAGSVGPGFQWNLLNYGRIANNVELQKYGLQELVANYQQTVLIANQEVEDSIAAFLQAQERYRDLEKSVTATEESLRLLTLSFEEGEIDFSGVFLLQGVLVGAQNNLAQAQGEIVTSLISLYKALGGGWEARCYGFRITPSGIDHSVEMLESPAIQLTPASSSPAMLDGPLSGPFSEMPEATLRSLLVQPPAQ